VNSSLEICDVCGLKVYSLNDKVDYFEGCFVIYGHEGLSLNREILRVPVISLKRCEAITLC
jgi:hypothetical protein